MQLVATQKHLGPRSFLACVLAINTTIILAIDMYVPALPGLLEEFAASASFLNLTMFMFMFVSAFAVLVAGPLVDKFGRKSILVFACAVFAVSSFGCALAGSVLVLTAFRIGQAIGFGLVMTDCTAIVKDAYSDEDLKFAMTLLQSLIIVGPVLAPFLGTFMLTVAGWRGIFILLGALGVASLALSCLITETLTPEQRLASGVIPALREMLVRTRELLSKRSFSSMSLVVGMAGLPYMGFIAVVSYILLDDFGVSYTTYSFVYAAICIISIIAPFVYLRISKIMGPRTITWSCIIVGAASGVLIWLFGPLGPVALLLTFAPYALMEGIIRPHGFVVLLDQPPEQVGNASAFVNCIYTVLGSFGTVIMTLPWHTYIEGMAIVICACTVIMAALFAWGVRKPR